MLKRIVYLFLIAILLFSGYKAYTAFAHESKISKAIKLSHSKNLEDWKKAIEVFEKDPKRWGEELYRLYTRIAQTAMANENWSEAIFYLKKALKVKPGDPFVTLDLAIATANLGKAMGNHTLFKESFKLYRKSSSKIPDSPLPYYGMGILKFWFWDNSTESKKEGITYLEKALQIDPSFERGYFALARAYYEFGDIANAVRVYRELLEILPPTGSKTARVYLNLYQIYDELDNTVKKLEYLKKAYKADPSNPDVLKILEKEGIKVRKWPLRRRFS